MKYICFLLILIIFFVTACADSKQEETKITNITSDTIGVESTESEVPVIPTRESVYVYHKGNELKQLILTVGGEPVLTGSGYLRLAGVVRGKWPVACLELAGRGLVAGPGDTIDEYLLAAINGKSILLRRNPK
jgi:hypothetical protein